MGLTVVPYQMRTRTNTDLNERFRRLHMRAPLRSLLSSSHLPFRTNSRTVQSRPSTRMMSTSLEQSRHRTNNEFDHEWAMSISNFNYRPYRQRCSSAQ